MSEKAGYPGLRDSYGMVEGRIQGWPSEPTKYVPPDVHAFNVGDEQAPCGATLIRTNDHTPVVWRELTGEAAADHVDRVTCLKCLRVLARLGAKP